MTASNKCLFCGSETNPRTHDPDFCDGCLQAESQHEASVRNAEWRTELTSEQYADFLGQIKGV